MDQALQNAQGSLSQLLSALASVFAPASRSTGEATSRPVRLHSEKQRMAADEVLASSDLDAVLARIDALSGDEHFWDAAKLTAQETSDPDQVLARFEASKLDLESLTSILGTTATGICVRGFESMKYLARPVLLVAKNLRVAPPGVPAEAPSMAPRESPPSAGPVELLYNKRLPLAFRRGLALALCSVASAIVIARAEECGKRLEPWLALALAEAFADPPSRLAGRLQEPSGFAGLVDTILESAAANERLRAAFEEWRRQAEQSGDKVFFPLIAPGDADQ